MLTEPPTPASAPLKRLARAACLFLVLPLVALYRVEARVLGIRRTFPGYSQAISLIPGLLGDYVRREFYRCTLRRFDPSSSVGFGTILSSPDISVAERVIISAYCAIGQCVIERNALIGTRVSILAGLHQHGTADVQRPIRDQPGVFRVIHIGEDCLIGEGAIVGADVREHSIVSTGSVVLREVPPYAVVRGNPATVIRTRT
jgi:acetyltransferase-like isoleucine patch superfamily enzyme